MKTHDETYEAHPPERSGAHRLLPIAGITAGIVAILAHLGGGAMLIHLGLGAGLAALGINVGRLGGGGLVVGLVVVISLKLLMVFGARRWFRHRSS